MWTQYTPQMLRGVLKNIVSLSYLQQEHNEYGVPISKPGSYYRKSADANRVS
jgi:hypothetical protein